MLLNERDECIDLRLGVADAWEGEQVDGDLSAGGRHQLRALLDLLQPIADRPVVGAEALVVEAEDADADRIQPGIDKAAEYVWARSIGFVVDRRLRPGRPGGSGGLHK